jgi:hypothetical protein
MSDFARFKGILLAGILAQPIRENSNGTPFRTVEVEIEYPDGSKETIDATLFENSRVKHEDKFAEGSVIELLVQVGGDYDGYAQVGLPGRRRANTAMARNTFKRESIVANATEEFITEESTEDVG